MPSDQKGVAAICDECVKRQRVQRPTGRQDECSTQPFWNQQMVQVSQILPTGCRQGHTRQPAAIIDRFGVVSLLGIDEPHVGKRASGACVTSLFERKVGRLLVERQRLIVAIEHVESIAQMDAASGTFCKEPFD